MPFISLQTTAAVTEGNKKSLTEKFGKAITLLPGKSESALMLYFEGGCAMAFKGDLSKPAAFVDVKVLGKSGGENYNKLTGAVTEIVAGELSIAPDQIFVAYDEREHWGVNGKNY